MIAKQFVGAKNTLLFVIRKDHLTQILCFNFYVILVFPGFQTKVIMLYFSAFRDSKVIKPKVPGIQSLISKTNTKSESKLV